MVLADEVLTPDSSRFWPADEWTRGAQPCFDKQYVRDWLTSPAAGWDRRRIAAPAPRRRGGRHPAAISGCVRADLRAAVRRLAGTRPVAFDTC